MTTKTKQNSTAPKLRVVQCWDDGVTTDIRLCEILRRYGGKASFNLNPGAHRAERYSAWKFQDKYPVCKLNSTELPAVYQGFTIANHSMTHPHPSQISIEAWKTEVVEARKKLQDHFNQPILGFAYPFGDFGLESNSSAAVMDVVRNAGHIYARTCENATPSFPAIDPLRQASDCHFLAENFWEKYQAAKQSAARVFYFWGHSYECVNEAMWQDFEKKIARIAADSEAVFADLPEVF